MKNKVISLFEKALQGKLKLNELYQDWPEELEGIVFFENIYDDLESAVEHLPGKILTCQPDLDKFKNSTNYYYLLVDLEILKKLDDFSTMNSTRKTIISRRRTNLSGITNIIKKEIDKM